MCAQSIAHGKVPMMALFQYLTACRGICLHPALQAPVSILGHICSTTSVQSHTLLADTPTTQSVYAHTLASTPVDMQAPKHASDTGSAPTSTTSP